MIHDKVYAGKQYDLSDDLVAKYCKSISKLDYKAGTTNLFNKWGRVKNWGISLSNVYDVRV